MASAFFNGAMCAGGWMQHMLFEAAHNGDLDLVRGMAMLLVEGRGRLGEAVQATRLRGRGPVDGMGALPITASKGRLEVCRYIIEELRLDVDDDDQEGRQGVAHSNPSSYALINHSIPSIFLPNDQSANPSDHRAAATLPIHRRSAMVSLSRSRVPPPARGSRRRPPSSSPVPLSPRQEMLLEAASDGNLGFLKRVVRLLDGGRGRPAEAVETVRECGAGALHLAAGAGKLAVCRYLVEELRVDANAIYDEDPHPLTHTPANAIVFSGHDPVVVDLVAVINTGRFGPC